MCGCSCPYSSCSSGVSQGPQQSCDHLLQVRHGQSSVFSALWRTLADVWVSGGVSVRGGVSDGLDWLLGNIWNLLPRLDMDHHARFFGCACASFHNQQAGNLAVIVEASARQCVEDSAG